MALQVWLPLNGNLDNQGLSSVTVTNNGATVDNSGKIGKCYGFDGSSSYIALASTPLFNCFKGGANPFSIAFWVYNGEASGARGVLFGDHATTGGVSVNIELNGNAYNNSIRFYWGANPDWAASNSILTPNIWSHVAITYNGSAINIYINGILKDTRSGALNLSGKTSGEFRIGRDNRTGDTAFKGKFNDFRIYDHCLSPKEVKEISKGLVLHYKLDDPYVEGTTNCGRMLDSISVISSIAEDWQLEKLDRDTVKLTALVSNPRYSTYGNIVANITSSKTVTAGTPCTLSCEVVDYKGSLSRIYPCSGGFGTIIGYQTFGNRVCRTITHTANWSHNICIRTSSQSQIVAGDYVIIRNTQIEEKDHATPYTPTSRSGGPVYDSSGYGRNGVMNAVATMASSTSRYREATHLPGVGNIYCASFPFVFEYLTFSVWAKLTTLKQLIDARNSSGVGYQPLYVDVGIETGSSKTGWASFYGDNMRYRTGEWIHYAVVLTPTSSNVFVNGEQYANGASSTGGTYNFGDLPIYLFSRYTNTNNITGDISDFRIYSTALSADDIKELYNTSAYIYNDGSIAAYEFNEINTASRELHPIPTDKPNLITHNADGSYTCSGYTWFHGDYIPINPSGKTYYYDIEYSNVAGNNFYIGFERYDANKSTGSNQECQYVVHNTAGSTRCRTTGTVDLSTANRNTAAYTKLRILNDWSNSGNTSYKGTIHYISLKEVATKTVSEVTKTGVFEGDTFIENQDASISHTGNVIGNQIIEI